MNPKTTVGLVIALVLAAVGVWWAESSGDKAHEKAASGPKPLIEPALADITEFEWVLDGAAPMKFSMQKDKWRMAAPVAGPAEHFVVYSDVQKLKDLKYSKSYAKADSERPTDEMTGLQKPQRSAKLTDKNGKSVVLKIGARQSLSSKTYVQKEGDDAVYLVDADLNNDLKHGLADYRGKKVCEYNPTDATRLEASGETQYLFTGGPANWTLETPFKARGDRTGISNVVRALSQLTADKFVDDDSQNLRPYGLDKPRLVIAVETETKTPKPPPAPPASAPAEPEFDVNKQAFKIAFGGSADEKVFAKLLDPASPAIFQIPESVFKQVAVKLDDLRDKAICNIETAKAQKVVVSSDGDSVTLEKQGGSWRIVSGLQSGEAAMAELAAVDDLLKSVKDLRAIGFEPGESPSQGFGKPRATIEITCEGQMEPMRITLGGVTASKTGAYLRNDREGTVAVVKADAVGGLIAKPVDFLGRDLMRFPRDMVSRIEMGFSKYTVTLNKEAGTWKFAAPVSGNAEMGAVNAILSDLAMLRGRRVVARAQDAAKYSLDSPTVRVTVTVDNPPKPKPQPPTTQPGPTPAPEMEVQPPSVYALNLTRIADKVYALAVGGSTICEIDGKVIDDCLAEFLDTKVINLEPSQARRLAYDGADKFAFEKSGDAWKLLGEPTFGVDPARITECFAALTGLKCTEYARYAGAKAEDYGLNSPQFVITAEAGDASPVKLLISPKGPEKGGRYASLDSAKDRVFVLKQEDVDKLSKKVQDFQKAG